MSDNLFAVQWSLLERDANLDLHTESQAFERPRTLRQLSSYL